MKSKERLSWQKKQKYKTYIVSLSQRENLKTKKARVINIYDNTISVEFDDYTGRNDELQRTVIKHDDYEKIED